MNTPQFPSARLLIVDDDLDFREALASDLSDLIGTVDCMGNADDAVDLLLADQAVTAPYDIVVVDLRLPRTAREEEQKTASFDSGLHTVRMLVALQRTLQVVPASTAIIVMTAWPSVTHCAECMKAGAYDFIPKDVDVKATGEDKFRTGIERLRMSCNELLSGETAAEAEFNQWLDKHLETLRHDRQNAAFIGVCRGLTSEPLPNDVETVEGFHVVFGDSYEAVRDRIVADRTLRWGAPLVIELAGHNDLTAVH